MNKISITSYPLRKKEVAYQTIGDELVILNLDSGIYYSANEIGARIWELCDGSKTIQEIVSLLSKEYEVSLQEARHDTLEFTGDLVNEGLIILQDEGCS